MSSKSKVTRALKEHAQSKNTDTVVVAHIHPGQVSSYFHHSMLGLVLSDKVGPQRIVGLLQEWSSANVSMPRNTLTAKFLDEYDADWLLWIDSDMSFDANALEQLLSLADPTRAPIVGGLCFGSENGNLFPTLWQWAEYADGPHAGKIVTQRATDYPENAMLQVGATGAAFLLIHRTALEAIRARAFNAVFPFFQETELAGNPCGEDITFCLRAGICGIPIHVNTAVKVGHHKSQVLTADLFRTQQSPPDPTEATP